MKVDNVDAWVPITAIHVHDDYLLFGTGNKLEVWNISQSSSNQPSLITAKWLTNRCSIHGIKTSSTTEGLTIATNGNRFITILILDRSFSDSPKLVTLQDSIKMSDWIMTTELKEDKVFAILTSSQIIIYNWRIKEMIVQVSSPVQCILYSALFITFNHLDNVLIVSGTVFKQAVVWALTNNQTQITNVLEGHDGAIFALEYDHSSQTLFTASDDRSIRVWSHKCCLDAPQNWFQGEFTLLHQLFGHISRIWCLLYINEHLVSCGENEDLCIWNRDSGKLVHKSTREDASLWCLAASKAKATVFVGSNDSSIRRLSMDEKVTIPVRSFFKFDQTFPKSLQFISDEPGKLLCVTNDGMLFNLRLDLSSATTTMETSHYLGKEFESYCLSSIRPGRPISVRLASKDGLVESIDLRFKDEFQFQAHEGKIFSCFHVSDDILLTSGPNGEIKLWKDDVMLNVYELPEFKHRWATKGLLVDDHLIIGDRNGHIFVFHGNLVPVQSRLNVHSSNGVNDLKFRPQSDLFYSCGREGNIFEYLWCNGNSIQQLRSLPLKVDFDWIERIIFDDSDNLFLIGFHSTKFIVWQERDQSILWEVNCGGGHRLWDFMRTGDLMQFCFAKQAEIFIFSKKFNHLSSLNPVVKQGFHSNKINCCRLLLENDSKMLLATGGEDNTILISEFDCANKKLRVRESLKGHISSVRAISSLTKSNGKVTIVSGGGRSQLIVWSLEVTEEKILTSKLDCHYLWNSDGPRRKPWKDLKVINDPQARYLAIDISPKNELLLIAVASSDSFLRLFSFNESVNRLDCLCETQVADYCPLSLNRMGEIYVTGTTDGFLRFWEVSTQLKSLEDIVRSNKPRSNSILSFKHCNLETVETIRFIEIHEQLAHQSGINCIALREISDTKWLIISCGDDTTLTLTLVALEESEVKFKVQRKIHSVHHSLISGVIISNGCSFLTASVDQRVQLWSYSLANDDVKVNHESSYLTCVADISSIIGFQTKNKEDYYAIVTGEGIQALKVSQIVR